MKKILALVAALLLVLGSVPALAEGIAADEAGFHPELSTGNMLAGGWTPAEDPAVTEQVQALVDKAAERLMGVNYKPVAYLGSQVVAGTNHAVLCQATVVYPNARPFFVIMYLYEDLQGNVSILNIADFDIGALCNYGGESD